MIFEENVDIERLPEIWSEKYREYLGVIPKKTVKVSSRIFTGPEAVSATFPPMPSAMPLPPRFMPI